MVVSAEIGWHGRILFAIDEIDLVVGSGVVVPERLQEVGDAAMFPTPQHILAIERKQRGGLCILLGSAFIYAGLPAPLVRGAAAVPGLAHELRRTHIVRRQLDVDRRSVDARQAEVDGFSGRFPKLVQFSMVELHPLVVGKMRRKGIGLRMVNRLERHYRLCSSRARPKQEAKRQDTIKFLHTGTNLKGGLEQC